MRATWHFILAVTFRLALMTCTGMVAGELSPSPNSATMLSVAEIAKRIRSQMEVTKPADMRAYTNLVPGTKANYAMVVIPAGEFVMGSPADGRLAKPDERPAHRVKLETFWMGRCEVTWSEFDAFMLDDLDGRQAIQNAPSTSKPVDAVTHPTLPYVDMSYDMGKSGGYAAIAMTQHAANQYCQWLSAKTGHFYRLPTEAEWEYAARAGSTNTWFFGEDESKLADYAWFEDNSEDRYHKVGRKLPNPWGLHDILGNVSEWVLDQFDGEFYQTCANKGLSIAPWNKSTQPYPHSVRGGSWKDPAESVRCAARGRSDRKWKVGDPQSPPSMFWFRNCDFVGFRIVRPLALPSTDEMRQFWKSGVERD